MKIANWGTDGDVANSQYAVFNFQFSICNPSPRGITLVELLVVLTIILLLAAATIPRLRPDMDRARVREAASLEGVNTLVVACPKDLVMFQDAIKTIGLEDRLAVKELSELVDQATW